MPDLELVDGEEVWVRGRVRDARKGSIQFRYHGISGTPGVREAGGWGAYIEEVDPLDIQRAVVLQRTLSMISLTR